jgi:hypothetical protein
MSNTCKFCKKSFTSLGNMVKHQKTTKYCIKIQKKFSKEEQIERVLFSCKYCNKAFTSKFHLNNHLELCYDTYKHLIENIRKECSKEINELNQQLIEKDIKLEKLEYDNQKLKEEVLMIEIKTEKRMLEKETQELKNTVNEIAKQPRVTTTTHNKIVITTPVDLSQPTVQLAIENSFSDEYLIQGQKGVARFAVDNILKDEQGKLKYICTDAARQIFQYKNKDGSMQKDVRATKLTKAILDGELKQTSHKIAWDKMDGAGDDAFMSYTTHYQNIQGMEKDNSEFSKELSCLTV